VRLATGRPDVPELWPSHGDAGGSTSASPTSWPARPASPPAIPAGRSSDAATSTPARAAARGCSDTASTVEVRGHGSRSARRCWKRRSPRRQAHRTVVYPSGRARLPCGSDRASSGHSRPRGWRCADMSPSNNPSPASSRVARDRGDVLVGRSECRATRRAHPWSWSAAVQPPIPLRSHHILQRAHRDQRSRRHRFAAARRQEIVPRSGSHLDP
jgi:hypothetical protein